MDRRLQTRNGSCERPQPAALLPPAPAPSSTPSSCGCGRASGTAFAAAVIALSSLGVGITISGRLDVLAIAHHLATSGASKGDDPADVATVNKSHSVEGVGLRGGAIRRNSSYSKRSSTQSKAASQSSSRAKPSETPYFARLPASFSGSNSMCIVYCRYRRSPVKRYVAAARSYGTERAVSAAAEGRLLHAVVRQPGSTCTVFRPLGNGLAVTA